MYDLILMKPSKDLQQQIWDYRRECIDHGDPRINGSCGLDNHADFDEWLALVQNVATREPSDDGVRGSTYVSVRPSDGRVMGTIQLRHTLNDFLREHGGHIGYHVRPTERGKGYGTAQLRLVLDVAREMDLPAVMLTCDKSNLASARTMMRCGGVLERENEHDGVPQQIYWIQLN